MGSVRQSDILELIDTGDPVSPGLVLLKETDRDGQ